MFPTQSSVDKQLAGSLFLAKLSNAVRNIHIQIFRQAFSFLFGIHLEQELLGHMVALG